MQPIDLKEKHVSTALFQFIFPISLRAGHTQHLSSYIQNQGFTFFQLNDFQYESAYYGSNHVSHTQMESFFLPITNTILFPQSAQHKGLHRYTKKLNLNGQLILKSTRIHFQIHSADIFICPYELGFLTVRTEINHLPYSQTQQFADSFRFLKVHTKEEQMPEIEFSGNIYSQVGDFLFASVFPDLQDFIVKDAASLLTPNKMYVQSFHSFQEEEIIDVVDVGSSTYTIIDEQCYSFITNHNRNETAPFISQFYGPFYYAIIIHHFHKLVFLKIAKHYSAINIDQGKNEYQHLIYTINSFTSNFFFNVYPAETTGQELFKQLRSCFQIDLLYTNTKETLFSLFKYEENIVTKRDSFLLLILTLYTVICGIFSMNLFTHDLVGKIKWSHFKSYNPFEYFAVFIVVSGIITIAILGIQSLYQAIQDRKNRKKWIRESVLTQKNDKLS